MGSYLTLLNQKCPRLPDRFQFLTRVSSEKDPVLQIVRSHSAKWRNKTMICENEQYYSFALSHLLLFDIKRRE